METDPKKIDFGKIEPYQKSEGGNMKEDLRANRGGYNKDYNKKEDTKSVNKNETLSAPAMSSPLQGGLNQAIKSPLQEPTELLSEAWELYKAKWKTFLGIVIAPILLILFIFLVFGIGAFGASFFSFSFLEFSVANFITYSVGFVLILVLFLTIFIIQIWSQAALIYAIKENGEIGIKEAYRKSKSKIKQFFWVSLLAGFITMGGFVFFAIPGFIFAIWFSFAAYIVIMEELRGMDAILKSREYVRNYWWPVFWRFLFINLIMIGVMIIAALASMLIPLVADIVSIILTPLIMIYGYLVYQNLKRIKGDFEFRPSQGLKKKFIAVGILGFIIIPLLLTSVVLVSLNSAKDKAMDAARRSDMAQVKIGLIIYYDEQGEYPKSLDKLSNIKHTDPKTKEPYEYRQLDNGKDYEICVQFEEKGRECFYSENDIYENPYRIEEETLTDSIQERDLQRISDLKFISTMLEYCKTETGNYPLSQIIAKLNENNPVVNEIKSANEDINIPIDPKYPEHYYGYKSLDGKTFELTARLEDMDDLRCDPEIEEEDGICIYKLRK